MSNMYTCVAYLIEIWKFCSKTWFIKVLILRPKMLQNSPTSTFNLKKNPGLYTRTPVKRGREGAREGRPPIHFPGYATAHYTTPLVSPAYAARGTNRPFGHQWRYTRDVPLRWRVFGWCCGQSVGRRALFIIVSDTRRLLSSSHDPIPAC